jgi:hypothetical protein
VRRFLCRACLARDIYILKAIEMKKQNKTSWHTIMEHNKKNTDIRYSKVTFGEHKGVFLKDIPVDYIKWAVMNLQDQAQATYFAEELLRREPKTFKGKK